VTTERGTQLHTTTDQQIAELIDLISTLDEAALRRPCPGREKLGDGTVGASAWHTADNYQRIASFVQTIDQLSGAHGPAQHGGHRICGSCERSATDPQIMPNTTRAPDDMTASTRQTRSM
jgi:hypothetical protein